MDLNNADKVKEKYEDKRDKTLDYYFQEFNEKSGFNDSFKVYADDRKEFIPFGLFGFKLKNKVNSVEIEDGDKLNYVVHINYNEGYEIDLYNEAIKVFNKDYIETCQDTLFPHDETYLLIIYSDKEHECEIAHFQFKESEKDNMIKDLFSCKQEISNLSSDKNLFNNKQNKDGIKR